MRQWRIVVYGNFNQYQRFKEVKEQYETMADIKL